VRDFALYATIVINVLALLGMIGGILMHSGQGGGLSDMFGGGGGAGLGSTSAERNLTRITTVLMVVWVMTVIALGFLLVRD
jgi:preprotein translocase subunit SecG